VKKRKKRDMIYKILNSKIAERTRRFIGIKTGVYLKLKKFTASTSEDLRAALILNENKIDCVIDVGANTGQFAESLRDFGYEKEIISFEPVQDCYEKLLERSRKYKSWTVAERCAIGEKDGTVDMNITADSVFSSVLKISDWHSKLKPYSKIIKTEEVSLSKLDTVVKKYVKNFENKRILLKIDTQGYEQQVLEGASELLKDVVGIKIEIPLAPIYEDVGFTFYKTLNFLEKEGFYPYSFNNEGVNLKTGRVNTIDGLFIREKA
jgi:FkbM family methyltransferase